MPEQPPAIAPVYRYYTADLLTNEILAEIPLRGVSWERALKGAGRFGGSIPVTEETDSIGLYDVTMPGQTAIYVVRNGVCVWGGIIWSRDYNLNSKELSVSASEFQSYFYHRKVWKTWNHKFGATITWAGNDELSWVETRKNWSINPDAAQTGNQTPWGRRYGWTGTWSTTGGPLGSTGGGRYVRLTCPVDEVGATRRGIDVYGNIDSTSPGSNSFPVEMGEFISLSVYVRPSSTVTGRIQYRIHNGASAWVTAAVTPVAGVPTSPNVWTRLEAVFSAPASGFLSAAFLVDGVSPAFVAGDTIDYANMLLEKASTVNSWFYGFSPETDGEDYAWEGTSHASPSVYKTRVGVPGFRAIFDNGSDVLVRPGSTVKLEFDDPGNIAYDGQYRVASTPAPTKDGFAILGGSAVADIVSMKSSGLWDIYYTKENHRFNTGDSIRLEITAKAGQVLSTPSVSSVTVDTPNGSASNMFRVARTSTLNAGSVTIDGNASRPLPIGVYRNTTVTVRQDTYDYIRTLIDAMFADFVGVDFPNIYLEPGLSTKISVIQKEAYDGHRIIKTAEPHGVAPGQAVQVTNVDKIFNGEYEVTDTPTPTTLVYRGGGNVPITPVTPKNSVVTHVGMVDGVARLQTSAPHGFLVGQRIDVSIGDPYGVFTGTWEILDTPAPNIFRFKVPGGSSYTNTGLPDAKVTRSAVVNAVVRVEVTSGKVTLQLRDTPTYTVGQSIAVSGVTRTIPLKEKALDSASATATIQTSGPHGLSVGDSIVLTGLQDTSSGVARANAGSSVTITTERPHNFKKGDEIVIEGVDTFRMVESGINSNVGTIVIGQNSIPVGATVTVENLLDEVAVSSRSLTAGVATIRTSSNHNFAVNDSVYIEGITDRYAVSSKEAVDGVVILTTQRPHNIQVGQTVTVMGVGVPFDGTEIEVEEATATRIVYAVDQKYWEENGDNYARKGEKLVIPLNVPQSKATGNITALDSYYNGEHVVTGRTNRSIQFWRAGNDMSEAAVYDKGAIVSGMSIMNGDRVVTARTATSISFAITAANSAQKKVPIIEDEEAPKAVLYTSSIHEGARTLTKVTANTVSFSQTMVDSSSGTARLLLKKASIFNGTRTITEVPSSDRLQFSLPGFSSSVYEEATEHKSILQSSIYSGTYTITDVDTVAKTISYALPGAKTFGSKEVLTRGTASVSPAVIVSTFGPYPGSAGVGVTYATQRYAGVDVEPTSYRGFELKSVGEVLETYADTINGFEYRIDCAYDEFSDRFTRTFVLVPINFPDNPPGVDVSSPERFGADKLVFEYPGGSITDMALSESAEESATRFFAAGTTSLGPDAGPDVGVATANDMLRGDRGRAWPLLDASVTVDGVEQKEILYGYAERYLSEVSQPYATISVSVNGSIPPYVDSYVPGDWCSLIIKDKFIQMRLENNLEPRGDVLVRKIDSYQVNVPDGVTFPETVQLNLVAEWEIDRGER